MKLIITNNPLVYEQCVKDNTLYLVNKDYLDVLILARDYLHQNYRLLTHPLSSNFLADKTFYKTIILEKGVSLDIDSINLIESAIIIVRNSLINRDQRIFNELIKKIYN